MIWVPGQMPAIIPGPYLAPSKRVSIYADGSSSGKGTGAIGYGYVIVVDGQAIDAGYEGLLDGTNNVAELLGAIRGIEAYLRLRDTVIGPNLGTVELVSDSQYVLGCASGKWNPSKNLELVAEIVALRYHVDSLRWCRGHQKKGEGGDDKVWNDRCDSLAKKGKEEAKARLAASAESESLAPTDVPGER